MRRASGEVFGLGENCQFLTMIDIAPTGTFSLKQMLEVDKLLHSVRCSSCCQTVHTVQLRQILGNGYYADFPMMRLSQSVFGSSVAESAVSDSPPS